MSESSQVILMRYYKDEDELDVFLNGNKLYTFVEAINIPYQLVDMLKKLGYQTFEKQMYAKRF